MGGLYTPRVIAVALIGTAACWMSTPTLADDAAGFVPRYPREQFMVYVSRPLGLRGAGAYTFGVRYERASPGSTDPAARFCAPLRHRSLVDLQLVRGTSPRMLLGPRITWDIGRRQLGPTSLANVSWPMVAQPLTAATLAAWVP
jgi:hypothetical protein